MVIAPMNKEKPQVEFWGFICYNLKILETTAEPFSEV